MTEDTGADDSVTSYRLTGTRMSPKRTRVDTGDATFVVGKDVNPVEYFLGSIVACINSTGTMVARDMDIDIEALEITVEGDVDYARYKGEASEARPGLQGLQVSIDVTADADESRLTDWVDAIENRCPVTDNVENQTPIALDLTVG